jgi:hypothetical protein
MQKRVAVLGALAVALALFVGGRAEASYNYATTLTITGTTGGATISNGGLTATLGGVTVTFAPESRTGLTTGLPSSPNIGDLTVSVAAGTTATSFTVTILDTIGITNVPPPGSAGSGNLTLTDTIVLSNISNVGGLNGTVTDTGPTVGTGSATVGGVVFTLGPPFGFSSPTLNGSGGNLSATINSTVPAGVPAPASLVMFGLGVGALGAIRLRRRLLSA